MASIRSVTIQARLRLKDTIISYNEETLEGFVENGGEMPHNNSSTWKGDLLKDGIIVWNRG